MLRGGIASRNVCDLSDMHQSKNSLDPLLKQIAKQPNKSKRVIQFTSKAELLAKTLLVGSCRTSIGVIFIVLPHVIKK